MNNINFLHKLSKHNYRQLSESKIIGCFYCLNLEIDWASVTQFSDEDEDGPCDHSTGICPLCGIDSLIGDASGIAIDKATFVTLNAYWFGESFLKP